MELENWLGLIRAGAPRPREWNRRLQSCMPGRTLAELEPGELAAFLHPFLDACTPRVDRAVARDLRWLEASPDRHLLTLADPRYPKSLLETADPPAAIFVRGEASCLARPCLAIVGSRNPTPQGRETAVDFGERLAGMGVTVVSGLAHGIDGCAHRGALETGTTAAVCGHGLDTVYPNAHRGLAADIAGAGALLSEFPPGTPPRRGHFPQRNRLISGLSLGTLVVEAGLRSGSLITARLAVEENREVFAVPGSISSPQSRGCHELIRSGATLVETMEDILREIDFFERLPSGSPGLPEARAAQSEHATFLDHMGYAPCTRDDLVKRSGLTSAEVSSMLLVLELEGCVELCPGGTYVRVTRS